MKPRKKLNIAMVSGFFYPNIGGVETHIFELSRHLIEAGHKVIIITHHYPRHGGIHNFLGGKLKVHYLKLPVMFRQCIWTNFVNLSAPLRTILIDENIEILHCHGSFSTMAQEALMFGNMLNLGMVFTEHSFHGFSDLGCFSLNGIWKLSTKAVDRMIGVSYCQTVNQFYRLGNENFCGYKSGSQEDDEKSQMARKKYLTIPNAIYPEQYKPNNIEVPSAKNTIVVVSRLTGRKGTPLMISVIEKLFLKYPTDLNLVIAGDGPCLIQVEELREKYHWHHRIKLLGAVQPQKVKEVLAQGRIFLNCSLSEAFCMAIVEAACAGLHVVTTNVGGIPEVLPESSKDLFCTLAKPETTDLFNKLEKAVSTEMQFLSHKTDQNFNLQRQKQYNLVKRLYTWEKITKRIENEYHEILQEKKTAKPIGDRIDMYLSGDMSSPFPGIQINGLLFHMFFTINLIIWFVLDRIDGKRSVQRVFSPKSSITNNLQ